MLIATVDLRGQIEAARDQGRRPTCLAFAASAVHRSAHKYPTELCPEWLYYHATRRDGLRPDQGSTIEATRSTIEAYGQPSEAFWPYQGKVANPSPYLPPAGTPNVVRCQSGMRPNDPSRWRGELDAGRPVAVVLHISATFYGAASYSGKEAIMGDDHDVVDPAMAHAVVLVGYGMNRNESYFLVRNSWGLAWGWGGHAWLPERYLSRRCAGSFVIHHGASDDVQTNASRTYSSLRVG
jgi:hypothetical protein